MTKHGAPDWYQFRLDKATSPVLDLGELAARLGSIVTFDKSGDVVFMEDFSHGLNRWAQEGNEVGWSIVASPDYYRSSGYSAKFVAVAPNSVRISLGHYSTYPRTASHGFEFSFTWNNVHTELRLYIEIATGSSENWARIRYLKAGHALYYLDSNQADIALADPPNLAIHGGLFHTLKLVLNPESNTYKRLMLNHETWDLTDIPMWSTPSENPAYVFIQITYYMTAGTTTDGYIDDVIITEEEP